LDQQRYCRGCSKWFHTTCLGEPQSARDTKGPLGHILKTLPVVRGWKGVEADNVKDWMTVGSFKRVERAIQKPSQNWEDDLGKDYIEYSTTDSSLLSKYSCPHCQQAI
jgi:hypothetical protein